MIHYINLAEIDTLGISNKNGTIVICKPSRIKIGGEAFFLALHYPF